jgi:ATP-dependent DNA helicase RecG
MHSLRDLKGIGEKTEKLFEKLGIFSQEDLLRYYPCGYEYYKEPVPIRDAVPGEVSSVEASILRTPSVRTFGNRSITIAMLSDGRDQLQADWFHMPYLRTRLRPGMRLVFRGRIVEKGNRRVMEHPKVFTPAEYGEVEGRLLPVYPLTAGITSQLIRKTVGACLASGLSVPEYLPEEIRSSQKLPEIGGAVRNIHFPESEQKLQEARRRLVFDEFFLFLLGVARMRSQNTRSANPFPMKRGALPERILASLPYRLTDGQQRILAEIQEDLESEHRMHRMIQGDVGSGKTILAFLAMAEAYENGYQSALMVPTEVLAHQHDQALRGLMERVGEDPDCCAYLTGSLTQKEKRVLYGRIESGEVRMVVGTHALIQERVHFKNLARVITDEQHRFGVRQREMLGQKGGENLSEADDSGEELPGPHVLVMSATPIPRTLALILYGDLDLSALREMPADRLRIKNAVVDRSFRPAAYRFLKKEIGEGHQAYIICPMVEENDETDAENVTDYAAKMKKEMGPEVRVGKLHGRMKPAEKERIMREFAEGKIDLLVSTTVIEVGVNVPNATVMMVENAERFGLAQLHQLRGRVGRGSAQSYCIFVSGSSGRTIPKRLEILSRSNDGFEIAEEDLRLRGPGDLFGVRQSGEALFELGDIYRDQDVLQAADRESKALLARDPDLSDIKHLRIKEHLEAYARHQNADNQPK